MFPDLHEWAMVPPPSTQMPETGNLGSEAQAYHPSNSPTPSLHPEPGLRPHRSPSPPETSSSTSYSLPHTFIPHTAVRRRKENPPKAP